MATTLAKPTPEKRPPFAAKSYSSLLTPRFWHGMTFSAWAKLLVRNRFAISPRRFPLACAISGFTLLNSGLRILQELMYGRRADARHLSQWPIFIIGHWRSGTTLLHELMVLDSRHNFPTTYQCFAPHHFLLTELFITEWFGFVLPSRRPMDNMEAGWTRPQEDEFALCNLGIRSPYLTIAFPNRPPADREYLDLVGLPPEEIQRWKDALLWFLKRVNYSDPRRIVLKSPPHTARVKTLAELFPAARFVHITRNPYEIFSSTMKLWSSLYRDQALQVSRDPGLREYVFDSLERMYAAYAQQRQYVPDERLHELRYEDLVADPVGQIAAIYDRFELGGFDKVQPRLHEYQESRRDYRTNRHRLDEDLRQEIRRRWSWYFEEFGYDAASPVEATPSSGGSD